MPAAGLPDELLEEIFLRLPPDEPAWLLRASLASKHWLGLLSGASFRGRYRELHGAPPMLGFLYSLYLPSDEEDEHRAPNFVPTTKFRSRIPEDGWRDWQYTALDCRHGRALLEAKDVIPGTLIVWDPMTGCETEFVKPRKHTTGHNHRAAVLCSATASGCDHRACHDGPFLVAFLGLRKSYGHAVAARAYVFSSEKGEWSEPCSKLDLDDDDLGDDAFVESVPPVLVEDALYFMYAYEDAGELGIIKYDLTSNCLSRVDVPVQGYVHVGEAILMAMEDGSLGFAIMIGLSLNLLSRQMGSDGVASWTQRRAVNLVNLLPTQSPTERIGLNGSVEGSDIIFLTTNLGVYEINLKSLEWKKLWKKQENFHSLMPYLSFCNPQEKVRPVIRRIDNTWSNILKERSLLSSTRTMTNLKASGVF